jgi:hypothetical protein
LYDRGLSRDDVLQLFCIIDWMMELPEARGQLFIQEAEQIEQEKHMPYVTSIERHGEQRGRTDMLLRALERRFQVVVPEQLATRIRGTTEVTTLEKWLDLAYAAATFEEFQQRIQT